MRRGDRAHQPCGRTARSSELSQVIQIGDGMIQGHLGAVVRGTVEETLNAMLDADADRLCRAERYDRTEARKDSVQVPTSDTCRGMRAKSR